MKFCPECGEERYKVSNFCHQCGFHYAKNEYYINETKENNTISTPTPLILKKGLEPFKEYKSNSNQQFTKRERITNISTGAMQTFIILNGDIWACGANQKGQLSNDSRKDEHLFKKVLGLTNIKEVAGGFYHASALSKDGVVWVWGNNVYGGLLENGNDMTYQEIMPPTQIKGLQDVTSLFSGPNSLFALKKDGTLWGWGNNWKGQLGVGNNSPRIAQVKLSDVVKVAGGQSHTLALKKDGTIWAWGYSTYGSTGVAGQSFLLPQRIDGLHNVIDIATGTDQSVALTSDGHVWTWGEIYKINHLGLRSSVPTKVNGLDNVQAIVSGSNHNVALRNDGTVWTWGRNNYGQLGNGTKGESEIPVLVDGLTDITEIKTSSTASHTIARAEDRTLWAWGYNHSGQLSNTTTENALRPTKMLK